MEDEILRGDVVSAAIGSGFGGKPRPFIAVQSDRYPTDRVILVGCTSVIDAQFPFRPVLLPLPTNGLELRCQVMIDIPVSSYRSKISRRIGRLNASELAEIDSALLIVLGFADV
ncbi:type II toxin-antitoxin system PemK/MazF family toxin [Sphingomonas sp. NFR15]|uniref:type II toxin-antitoxin system PemK/MazF family toxin n=1 Tax=Sphingomonas sp. NFR15 TaxID=1566282 RepID=UPI00088E044F|nr:type II toxin-antitoxin system PemK/MazF family toxin [Sphingomonas sp. NFR15]SDA27249.1 PemK-like, MazF-like toxin of type II toxin-antitoxin system [Sphingomonas sp. NFR15]